jgi:hypothetical protein
MSTTLDKVNLVGFEKFNGTGNRLSMEGSGCLSCGLQAACCNAMPGAQSGLSKIGLTKYSLSPEK